MMPMRAENTKKMYKDSEFLLLCGYWASIFESNASSLRCQNGTGRPGSHLRSEPTSQLDSGNAQVTAASVRLPAGDSSLGC
eukprot:120807-Amphidinium_carterae.1